MRPLGALFTLLCHHTGRLCAPEAKRRRPQQIAVKSQGLSPVLQPHRISMSGTAKSIHHVRYVRGISCIHTEWRQERGAFKMSQCPFSCGFLTMKVDGQRFGVELPFQSCIQIQDAEIVFVDLGHSAGLIVVCLCQSHRTYLKTSLINCTSSLTFPSFVPSHST